MSTSLDVLCADFWTWRAQQQPRGHDDIPRLERPPDWIPDFSAPARAEHAAALQDFEQRLDALDPGPDGAVAECVDHLLLRSAMARVRWESDVLRMWERHPGFYVHQSLGCVFDLLTPVTVDAGRIRDVTRHLASTPKILDDGRANLDGTAVAEFAALSVAELATVESDIARMVDALIRLDTPGLTPADVDTLRAAGAAAAVALGDYRDWIAGNADTFVPWTPVGADAFQWFLTDVALLPFNTDELLAIGRREADRAAALELLERRRNGTPGRAKPPPVFSTGAEQAATQAEMERGIRRFYEERGLLSQPDWMRNYNTHPLPDHLAPITWLGVADDLTGPSRLDENGSAFFPPPGPDLPYFYAANAHDPRLGIVHEGVHYQQLVLSWAHPRPVRRHYYDSTANEGIAFYNEEMMLASGLFDDNPRSREVIYNFMRLRALRVVVDVHLARGSMTIDEAGAFLEREVPMDAATAREEAAFFASTPGLAMSYQVGKTQLLALLNEASRADEFDLQAFHDRVWLDGNVPFSLQRWELLGDRSELERIEELRRRGVARHG